MCVQRNAMTVSRLASFPVLAFHKRFLCIENALTVLRITSFPVFIFFIFFIHESFLCSEIIIPMDISEMHWMCYGSLLSRFLFLYMKKVSVSASILCLLLLTLPAVSSLKNKKQNNNKNFFFCFFFFFSQLMKYEKWLSSLPVLMQKSFWW